MLKLKSLINEDGPIDETMADRVKRHLTDQNVFPCGKFKNAYTQDNGDTLYVILTGDVPTNFKEVMVIMRSPDAPQKGWVKSGHIGLLFGPINQSGDLAEYPMPWRFIESMKAVYYIFTGKQYQGGYNRKDGATTFAEPGFLINYKTRNKGKQEEEIQEGPMSDHYGDDTIPEPKKSGQPRIAK